MNFNKGVSRELNADSLNTRFVKPSLIYHVHSNKFLVKGYNSEGAGKLKADHNASLLA